MSNINRSGLDALSSSNFPDNTTQLISAADLRDWIESAVDSFVTQKDKSTFENAFYEAKSATILAAPTVLLSSASGNFVHIQGTTNITSFGTCPAGSRFILCFEDAANIDASSAIIIPGTSSGNTKTAVPGDCCMIVSEGSGNWRIVGYFPAAAAGAGTVTQITAASPLTGGTITTSGTIGIPQASASQDGYLDQSDFATFAGKQDVLSAGTGISIASNTVTNTAPDQTVSLTPGTGIGVTGSYPSFTISNTSPSSGGTITALTGDVTASGSGSVVATIANGAVDIPMLSASGTPSSTTYLRGDNTWATVSGGGSGTVTSVGTTGLISGGPITTSGTITTSMATGKLVGRYSSGTGIMEEVTIGSGLTLTAGGTLNNTATPTPTGYYAQYQSLITQTAAANNTGYPMRFEVMDLSNQVTVVNNGSGNPTRITFANAGIYNLQFSSQFQNTDNAQHDITIWLRLNGSDVAGSAGFVQIPARKAAGSGNEGHLITSWNYLLDVSAGQYYELVWSTSSASNVTMQFYAAGSPPPSTASALFTVTQQAGIMAGTGITSINSLTGAAQTIATGTSGTDFAVVSSGTSHTFNMPDASASARGLITTGAQTLAGIKTFGNGASAGEIRLLEASGSGANYVAVKSPTTLASDYSLTLPINTGISGYSLITDGNGVTSWSLVGGGVRGSFIIDATQTSVTGTTAETINKTLLIPANTFDASNAFNIKVRLWRSNESFNVVTVRIYISTSPSSTSGAPLLLNTTISSGTGLSGFNIIRSLLVINKTTQSIYLSSSGVNNVYNDLNSGTYNSTAIDWSVNQYIVITTASNSATYTTYVRSIQVTPE